MRIELRIRDDDGQTVYQSMSGDLRLWDGSFIDRMRGLPDETLESLARMWVEKAKPIGWLPDAD
jgi:hypothetical protein